MTCGLRSPFILMIRMGRVPSDGLPASESHVQCVPDEEGTQQGLCEFAANVKVTWSIYCLAG